MSVRNCIYEKKCKNLMFFTTVFEKEIESYAFIHKKYKNSKVFVQKLQKNFIIRMRLILIGSKVVSKFFYPDDFEMI